MTCASLLWSLQHGWSWGKEARVGAVAAIMWSRTHAHIASAQADTRSGSEVWRLLFHHHRYLLLPSFFGPRRRDLSTLQLSDWTWLRPRGSAESTDLKRGCTNPILADFHSCFRFLQPMGNRRSPRGLLKIISWGIKQTHYTFSKVGCKLFTKRISTNRNLIFHSISWVNNTKKYEITINNLD